jgi:DNA-binding MarR family transcriptional regulator
VTLLLTLQRATHVSLHALANRLAGLDLSASEINALANLAGGSGRTIGELGSAIGARPTTVTSLLDRLERRRLVARTPHPADRRAVLVSLTPGGERSAEAVVAAMAEVERAAIAGVSDADIRGFHAVLAALTEVST